MKLRPAARPPLMPKLKIAPQPLGSSALARSWSGWRRQLRVADPVDRRMVVEEGDHLARVLDVAGHAHVQGLDALEDVEGRLRRHRRAEVPQPLGARPHQEGGRAELLGEVEAVVAGVGLGQGRELARRLPVEGAAVDQGPGDGDAVAAQELGRRVHDDVGAVLERPAQVGRGEGVVDHQRDRRVVGDLGDRRQVHDLQPRVAQGLAEDQPRLRPDRLGEALRVARVDEGRLDAEAGQRMGEQVVAAAVDRRRRDDVPALTHQGGDAQEQRRLAARRADRPDAALERGQPLLQHRDGRVGDARIDVPGPFQVEQRRRLVGVFEHVGGGLVDRHRPRAGGRIGVLPGVKAERVELEQLGVEHGGLAGVEAGRVA